MKKNPLILSFILFLFLLTAFLTLPRTPLQNDDASTYALAAKNMIVHGQWLAPLVTPGDPSSFFDKPPLGIWLLAWFPKLFGLNELTIHAPNVIYFCLFLLIFYLSLARIADKKTALYSTLISSTSLALVVYSRSPKLDLLLMLFSAAACLALFAFLMEEKPVNLYIFSLSAAGGFLIKSGFGMIIPALTVLALFLLVPTARQKLSKTFTSFHPYLCLSLFLCLVLGVLYAQSFALKEQWLPYLQSITVHSKYNTGYLGLDFNYSIFGLLLITLFPWMPLFLTALKPTWNLRLKSRFRNERPERINSLWPQIRTANLFAGPKTSLSSFCSLWFWANFLFLLFFYRQTDFRTFVIFVPPMAILAGSRLSAILDSRERTNLSEKLWQALYLLIFVIGFMALLNNPYNGNGVDISAALLPVGIFVIGLTILFVFYFRPSAVLFTAAFAVITIAYASLFYNTKPLVESFNPDLTWPGLISKYKAEGYKFYIYRPHDRNLFYSPDLLYVDFIAGPADKYFWEGEALKSALIAQKAVVLSDTKSWDKLKLNEKVLVKDDYSRIVRSALNTVSPHNDLPAL